MTFCWRNTIGTSGEKAPLQYRPQITILGTITCYFPTSADLISLCSGACVKDQSVTNQFLCDNLPHVLNDTHI